MFGGQSEEPRRGAAANRKVGAKAKERTTVALGPVAVLVAVVATVVVSITQPVWLHTDCGALALKVISGTSDIPRATHLGRLVAGLVVFAVIDTIADLSIGDAPMVVTGELALGTFWIVTVQLVGAITTVVLVITLPGLEDATTVAAPVLGCGAGVIAAVVSLLIAVVPTVIISITGPQP